MSEASRITGVFFEPGKAFADIAQRPRWLVPVLLIVLATAAYFGLYGHRIGYAQYVQEQMEKSSIARQQMEQLTPEQRQNSINLQVKIQSVIFPVLVPLFLPIGYLISAAIVLGIASGMMGAGVKFKQVYAITCYSGLTGVVARGLAIVVLFLKNPEDFDLMNPIAFNPAAFMDAQTSSKFLYTLATGLDLFALWGMILGTIGLKAAAGKRISTGGAAFAVFAPWAIFVLFGASVAGFFS